MRTLVVVVFVLCLPSVVLAQTGGGDSANLEPPWMSMVIGALVALTPALLSTFLPSRSRGIGGFIMRVIDVLAFNWGKARNDKEAQK